MRTYQILFIFLVGIFISTCKSEFNKTYALKDKLQSQKEFLTNRKILSLRKILGDSVNTSKHVIFLYNGFDCGTCIDQGYRVSKTIDSLAQSQITYIISTSANIGADQLRNEYKNFVYSDESDLIRIELKYIYTPVLLSLDSLNRIDGIYYPTYNGNVKEEKSFVLNCLGIIN